MSKTIDLSHKRLRDKDLSAQLDLLANGLKVERFNLNNNNLKSFSNLFRRTKLKNVQVIDASHNNISSLDNPLNVNLVQKLRTLYLDFNKISSEVVFIQLIGLSHLSLVGNNLQGEFCGQQLPPGIKEVDLSYNAITLLTDFKYVSKLEVLTAGGNLLTVLPDLHELSCLKEIWLNKNKIENIPGGHFPVNVEKVYLYDNKIVKISNIFHLKKLTILALSGNKITEVPAFHLPSNTETLDLSCNAIASMKCLPTGLENVNLSGNLLNNIGKGCFTSEYLYKLLKGHLSCAQISRLLSPPASVFTEGYHAVCHYFNITPPDSSGTKRSIDSEDSGYNTINRKGYACNRDPRHALPEIWTQSNLGQEIRPKSNDMDTTSVNSVFVSGLYGTIESKQGEQRDRNGFQDVKLKTFEASSDRNMSPMVPIPGFQSPVIQNFTQINMILPNKLPGPLPSCADDQCVFNPSLFHLQLRLCEILDNDYSHKIEDIVNKMKEIIEIDPIQTMTASYILKVWSHGVKSKANTWRQFYDILRTYECKKAFQELKHLYEKDRLLNHTNLEILKHNLKLEDIVGKLVSKKVVTISEKKQLKSMHDVKAVEHLVQDILMNKSHKCIQNFHMIIQHDNNYFKEYIKEMLLCPDDI